MTETQRVQTFRFLQFPQPSLHRLGVRCHADLGLLVLPGWLLDRDLRSAHRHHSIHGEPEDLGGWPLREGERGQLRVRGIVLLPLSVFFLFVFCKIT